MIAIQFVRHYAKLLCWEIVRVANELSPVNGMLSRLVNGASSI